MDFSDLPQDSVILIISFLSLLDAFRLCLLRKEWYHFQGWKHCSSIELDEAAFRSVGKQNFVFFLNRTLPEIKYPVISTFRLKMSYTIDHHQDIDRWVDVASLKNVIHLCLDFSHHLDDPMQLSFIPQYNLPQFFYDGKGMSVRVLCLNTCLLGSPINLTSFIRLTSLILIRVGITTDEMGDVLTTCPILETLVLEECHQLFKLEICCTTTSTLKRLVVRHCELMSMGIHLCLPSLQFFEYAGGFMRFYTQHLDHLQEVVLDYNWNVRISYQSEEIRGFFPGFSQAKSFTVSTSALMVLPFEYCRPLFQLINVKHLTIKTCMEKHELSSILCLLRSAPRLKTLSIFARPKDEFTHLDYLDLPKGFWIPERWTSHPLLELVNVENFSGIRYEVDLIKFILIYSMMKGRVTIRPWKRGNTASYSRALDELNCAQIVPNRIIIECIE